MGFLRDVFGPSKAEIWRQFAATVGGQYIEGGFWRGDKVLAAHGQWMVTLDTYTVSNGKTSTTYTRMRAPYVNPDGFTFKIYRKGIFSELGKWLGMQDVTVGYPEFDEAFIIKGNDVHQLQKLFANRRIRELVSAQPAIRFSVRDDEGGFWNGRGFPPGVDELYFDVVGVIRDADRLWLLYELFAETLDELCRLGSAYQDSPRVQL